MTLDKAIRHGKVKRRPYRGSNRFDRSCRNHGSCGYCRGNRLHCRKIAERSADEQIREAAYCTDILCLTVRQSSAG